LTLILTVANSRGVYQSSDYQLTDQTTGGFVSDFAGSKQLVASFEGLHLILAFTGVATWRFGSRIKRTTDWLSATLSSLPPSTNLQTICRTLAEKSEKWCGSSGPLTLVLSVASVGRRFQVVEISNTDWGTRPPSIKRHFDIRSRLARKPFHNISGGGRDSVPKRERFRLKAIARKINASPKEVMTALAEINSISAASSKGSVSKECWATAQFADGNDRRSQTINFGPNPGVISQLLGGMDLATWVKANLTAIPGKEIGMAQSTSLTIGPGGGIPAPEPTGEPKSFLISGSSVTGLLKSPSGKHCASIEIGPVAVIVTARRNEFVTVPFAQMRLTVIQPISENFARPKLPWPMFQMPFLIDGDAAPNGWEFRVVYWIEHGTHHLEIPQSSRGIRKVASLGDDYELVIAMPAQGHVFSWESTQPAPIAMLEASVRWANAP
jgi:hypothetical protein